MQYLLIEIFYNLKQFIYFFLLLLILAGCATSLTTKHDDDNSGNITGEQEYETFEKHENITSSHKTTFAMEESKWSQIPDWSNDNLVEAWPAFLASCLALSKKSSLSNVCVRANKLENSGNNNILRAFFEENFKPLEIVRKDRSPGLITGYYEPLIEGSLTKTEQYRYPILGAPTDLLDIELGKNHKELKGKRVRGRLDGKKVIPYYTREEIELNYKSLNIPVLLWAKDNVSLFFLQIQGSGRVIIPSGEILRIGYANHNGQPYSSIGKLLIKSGEISIKDASMQGLKRWAALNKDKVQKTLNLNKAYVFFRIVKSDADGPLGALNVPLTAGRSLAVDPEVLPLGYPVYLSTTYPNSSQKINKLMFAQDTGGAIKGPIRGDYFWGFGEEAGKLAGKMKQKGRMWLIQPR